MVQWTLSVVSSKKKSSWETNVYLDAKLTHFPLVETDHFYKQDLVSHFRVQLLARCNGQV